MKEIFIRLSLCVMLVLVTACRNEEVVKEPAIIFEPYCNMAPEFGADGGRYTYGFTAEYDWTVECVDEWVSVTPESGTALEGEFTLVVAPHDNGEERSSYIIVRLANGEAQKIDVKQRMRERFDVEQVGVYVIDAEAGTIELKVATNIEYKVVVPVGAGWISLAQTRSMRDDTLSFSIKPNTSTKSRIAVITLRDIRNTDEVLHSFTVVQSASGNPTNEIVYQSEFDKPLAIESFEGYGSTFALHRFDGRYGRIIFNDDVTTIPYRAFANMSDLAHIQLPGNLKTIEAEAFVNCSTLTTLTIPSSVTTIGDDAFVNCSGIDTFVLPCKVTNFGSSMFRGCAGKLVLNCNVAAQPAQFDAKHWLYGSEFNEVTVNANLGENAFYGYQSLENIIFGTGCTLVKVSAFEGSDVDRVEAESLAAWCNIMFENAEANPLHVGTNSLCVMGSVVTRLDTPEGMKSIGKYAFYNYQLLDEVSLGDDILTINAGAFARCNLESLYLGKNLSAVGEDAFAESYCGELTINFSGRDFSMNTHWLRGLSVDTVIFGEDVEIVGLLTLSAFDLTNLIIGDSVTEVRGGAFANCTNLQSVTFGSALKTLSEHAFVNCSALRAITLPESLETLSGYVFDGCTSLESITIPERVTSIGEYCFNNCSALQSVYLESTTPPALSSIYVFPASTRIYVPAESLPVYLAADYWMSIASQIKGYN